MKKKCAAVSAGITSKSGSTPILKCPTQFPLILWHPSARHYYFCMMTEAEQDKWQAVLQDCIRHCNNGEGRSELSEGQGAGLGRVPTGDTCWLSVVWQPCSMSASKFQTGLQEAAVRLPFDFHP